MGQGDGTFAIGASFGVGTSPSSLVVCDFNGDGIPDLAVVDYGASTVEVHQGYGTGAFHYTPINAAVGYGPLNAVAGDFNADGIPDLAVTNSGDNTVSILLGNGDGTFTQASNSPVSVGTDPVSIAAADFNGDGIFDLAVVNEGENTTTLLTPQLIETAYATASFTHLTSVKNHAIDASYPGDGSYLSSTSGTVVLTGQPSTPSVVIAPSSSSVTTAQVLTLIVSVNGGAGAPTPTGTIFVAGGGYVSSLFTLSSGAVTINVQPGALAVGTDTLTATYVPDSSSSSSYNSSTGSTTVSVSPIVAAAPTVTVTPSSSSITTNEGLTVTVSVSGGNGNATPSGLITLRSSIPAPGSSPLVFDSFQYARWHVNQWDNCAIRKLGMDPPKRWRRNRGRQPSSQRHSIWCAGSDERDAREYVHHWRATSAHHNDWWNDTDVPFNIRNL